MFENKKINTIIGTILAGGLLIGGLHCLNASYKKYLVRKEKIFQQKEKDFLNPKKMTDEEINEVGVMGDIVQMRKKLKENDPDSNKLLTNNKFKTIKDFTLKKSNTLYVADKGGIGLGNEFIIEGQDVKYEKHIRYNAQYFYTITGLNNKKINGKMLSNFFKKRAILQTAKGRYHIISIGFDHALYGEIICREKAYKMKHERTYKLIYDKIFEDGGYSYKYKKDFNQLELETRQSELEKWVKKILERRNL